MSILVNADTRVLVQGITGRIGRFHAEEMIDYGTNVVGGVTPGKGGEEPAGPADLQHGEGGGRRDAGRRVDRLRAAAVRRRLDHGGGRRRHPVLRLHHRRHPDPGHDAGQALHAPLPGGDRGCRSPARTARAPSPPASACSASCRATSTCPAGSGIIGRSGTLGYEAAVADAGAGHRGVHRGGHRRRPGQRLVLPRPSSSCFEADADTDAGADDRRDRRRRRRPRARHTSATT